MPALLTRGLLVAVTMFVVWVAVDALIDTVFSDDGVHISWSLALIVSLAVGFGLALLTQGRATR